MLRQYEMVLKAAADPNRARILKMLEDSELCVCQIVAVLGLSQSTISKHLAILRDAGLLDERKVGRWVYFRLASSPINEYAPQVLRMIQTWLENDAVIAADREKAVCVRNMPVEKLCALSPEETLRICQGSEPCEPCMTANECAGSCTEEEMTHE